LGLLSALCASGGEHRSVRPESTTAAAAAAAAAAEATTTTTTAAALGSAGCPT